MPRVCVIVFFMKSSFFQIFHTNTSFSSLIEYNHSLSRHFAVIQDIPFIF